MPLLFTVVASFLVFIELFSAAQCPVATQPELGVDPQDLTPSSLKSHYESASLELQADLYLLSDFWQ